MYCTCHCTVLWYRSKSWASESAKTCIFLCMGTSMYVYFYVFLFWFIQLKEDIKIAETYVNEIVKSLIAVLKMSPNMVRGLVFLFLYLTSRVHIAVFFWACTSVDFVETKDIALWLYVQCLNCDIIFGSLFVESTHLCTLVLPVVDQTAFSPNLSISITGTHNMLCVRFEPLVRRLLLWRGNNFRVTFICNFSFLLTEDFVNWHRRVPPLNSQDGLLRKSIILKI